MLNLKSPYYFLLLCLLTISCRHQPLPYPTLTVEPVVMLIPKPGYVAADTILQNSEQFSVSLFAITDTVKNRRLVQYSVLKVTQNDTTVVLDSAINRPSFWGDFVFASSENSSSETWIFRFTDNAGYIGEETIKLQLQSPQLSVSWIQQSGYLSGFCELPRSSHYQTGITASVDISGGNHLSRIEVKSLFQGTTQSLLDSSLQTGSIEYHLSRQAKNIDGLERIQHP